MAILCNNCGFELEEDWSACPECGEGVSPEEKAMPCPSCGFSLKPKWNVCPKCRHKIRDTAIGKPIMEINLDNKMDHVVVVNEPTLLKRDSKAIGRGEIIQDLGFKKIMELPSGGMADLVLAEKDGQKVVFKFLKKEFEKDPEYIRRFISEAKRTSALKHPNIITIFNYETDENAALHYYVMEYLSGGTLADQIKKRGKFPVPEAVPIIIQLASALQVAHETVPMPIVHRDIKPSNILFDGNRVVLTDFGIAKSIGGHTQMTSFGQIVGSVGYMSPEQLRGQIDKIDHRSDIYSLGVVFYRLLTGKEPFEGPSEASVTTQHLMKPVVPPSVLEPTIPPYISGIIIQMLEKEPERRLANVGVLIKLLSAGSDLEVQQHYTRVHALYLGAYEQGSSDTQGKTLIKKPADSFGFNLSGDEQFMKLCNMWMQYQAGVGAPIAGQGASQVFSCPNCKSIVHLNDKVCTHCGVEIGKIKKKCSKCGSIYLEGQAYCSKCKTRFIPIEYIKAKELFEDLHYDESYELLLKPDQYGEIFELYRDEFDWTEILVDRLLKSHKCEDDKVSELLLFAKKNIGQEFFEQARENYLMSLERNRELYVQFMRTVKQSKAKFSFFGFFIIELVFLIIHSTSSKVQNGVSNPLPGIALFFAVIIFIIFLYINFKALEAKTKLEKFKKVSSEIFPNIINHINYIQSLN